MRLSTRGRYALRMMTELARQQNGGHVSLGDISDITGISRRYLDQLVISLKRASLLSGRSGKTGGYRLNKSSADITVRQIVEAAIGPINVVECVKHPNSCLKSDGCECRFVYVLINDRITGVLDQIPLSHLVNHDVFKQVAG